MKIINDGGMIYGIHPDYAPHFHPEHFDPTWWQAQNAVVGQSRGRGITWFVRLGQQELVLRHYYRGGMVGKLLNDRYLFNGFQRSRAVMEFHLLEQMRTQELPVPQVYAVRMIRHGLFYRTDILLGRIPKAQDLVYIMREYAPDAATWQCIGHTIRRFHNANINHADLNCHNILLDESDKPWLIDFDKGAKNESGEWKQANLERLHRSLRKEKTLNPELHWQENDWEALLSGYGKITSNA